tara:strand:- start:6789 stop:6992 length:204 start_codon:yes stop_codon:yes gene_type:complete
VVAYNDRHSDVLSRLFESNLNAMVVGIFSAYKDINVIRQCTLLGGNAVLNMLDNANNSLALFSKTIT